MAKWSGNKVNSENINNGNEYTTNDNLSIEAVNGIVNNSINAQKNAERALELATGANEANGTVVKINGEPQATWDATFAENLYEDSKNKISLINLNSEAKGLKISKNENDIINLKGQANKSYATWISKTPIDLETGTYTFSRTTSLNFSVILKLFNSSGVSKNYYIQPNNRTTFETTEKMVAYEVWSEGIPTGVEIDVSFGVQLEKGNIMTSHYPYNPNRHITNSEAEFLKDEFEKSANLYYGNTVIGALQIDKDEPVTTEKTRMTSAIYYKVNPNTKYSISFDGLDDITYVSYTSDKVLIKDNNWQYSNKITITTSDNAGYVRFAFRYSDNREITSINEISNIMFNEGEPLPYQSYNSSSHITNAQADLLKSEWEKSVNLIDVSKMSEYYINVSTGALTSNSWWNLSDYIEVKGSTPYTISCSYIPNNRYWQKSITYFNENKTFISGLTHNNEYDTIPKFTFTPPSNAKYVRIGWAVIQGDGINVEIKNVMLNEGTEALPYQEWNGEIIHEKDIKEVTVWENASPNATFLSGDIITKDRTGYTKTIVYATLWGGGAVQRFEFEGSISGGFIAFDFDYGAGGQKNTTRKFDAYSDNPTKITFYDAYENGSTNNDRCIPVKICVSNY